VTEELGNKVICETDTHKLTHRHTHTHTQTHTHTHSDQHTRVVANLYVPNLLPGRPNIEVLKIKKFGDKRDKSHKKQHSTPVYGAYIMLNILVKKSEKNIEKF